MERAVADILQNSDHTIADDEELSKAEKEALLKMSVEEVSAHLTHV